RNRGQQGTDTQGVSSLDAYRWTEYSRRIAGLCQASTIDYSKRTQPNRADQMIQELEVGLQSIRHQRTTIFTSFFGTTIFLTICFPAIAALTFWSASAASRT